MLKVIYFLPSYQSFQVYNF